MAAPVPVIEGSHPQPTIDRGPVGMPSHWGLVLLGTLLSSVAYGVTEVPAKADHSGASTFHMVDTNRLQKVVPSTLTGHGRLIPRSQNIYLQPQVPSRKSTNVPSSTTLVSWPLIFPRMTSYVRGQPWMWLFASPLLLAWFAVRVYLPKSRASGHCDDAPWAMIATSGQSKERCTISVCQGGICESNGGALLLEYAQALGSGDPLLAVAPATCFGTCPKSSVIVEVSSDDGCRRTVCALDEDRALGSASELIASASGEVPAVLQASLLAKREGDSASRASRPEEAVAAYTSAISAHPEPYGPAQEEVPPDRGWEGTRWLEQSVGDDENEGEILGSELVFEDNAIISFEFGSCRDGAMMLTDCSEDSEGSLRGFYEEGDDTGELVLTMRPNGLTFDGQLTSDTDGSVRSWLGFRCAEAVYDEPPPGHVRWLFESLVGRSRAHLRCANPDPMSAAKDARAAVKLCCNAAVGWAAMSEAAKACGDADELQDARGRLTWLLGGSPRR